MNENRNITYKTSGQFSGSEVTTKRVVCLSCGCTAMQVSLAVKIIGDKPKTVHNVHTLCGTCNQVTVVLLEEPGT